ncbi:MAG: hypothetical protein J5518_05050 [Lachnospiraceae bacterium]|nr:hypothetical protein [Lachnospiraceae bacterium]
MMPVLTVIIGVIANFIIYLAFGSLLTKNKNGEIQLALALPVGFFAYYSLFFFVCIPVMKWFRPLSLLTAIWVPIVAVIVLVSLILNGRALYEKGRELFARIRKDPLTALLLVAIVAVQIFIVTTSYNFTLDASYYVAGVATNVDTNMINVYDPFTGAWQDHFEMRYFFATYPVSDAVVCQLTHIPALVQTKSIMASVVILLTNLVYYLIAGLLFEGKERARVLMLAFMLFMNLMFITIYTPSLFLFTRTYEGKAIVGNLSIITILYFFILLVKDKKPRMYWLLLFLVCFGSTTVSSTANMLIPAELSILFLPDMLMKKRFRELIPYALCILPGILLALTFVAYVKGKFVFYTYPVW